VNTYTVPVSPPQRTAQDHAADDRRSAPCCSHQALRAMDLMSTLDGQLPDPRSHAGQRIPLPAADETSVAMTTRRADYPGPSSGHTDRTIRDLRRYVGPNDTLSAVARAMHSGRVAELPVLDGRGVVVGVITAATLVETLIQSEYQHHRPDRDAR
jgi:hypothetical protein